MAHYLIFLGSTKTSTPPAPVRLEARWKGYFGRMLSLLMWWADAATSRKAAKVSPAIYQPLSQRDASSCP
ncbi:hypothetical protein [Halomonas sp. DWK9]|uniref:hypothetical protein n=1 Tax=Halomonadaceae TaxID=28256 RepID=UPI00287F4DC8|nr:hypothetical protein [Halomonas sp. DWK9]